MKKISIITFFLFICGIATVFAEIKEIPDKFTNGIIIRSSYTPVKEHFKIVYLSKIIDQKTITYEMLFSTETLKEFILDKSTIEIKIDTNPVYNIPVKDLSNIYLNKGDPTIAQFYTSTVTAAIPDNIIFEIKSAKRVALRFHEMAGGSAIYILPDKVLTEWQQVINTEK